MTKRELQVSIGQFSDKGRKTANQDFHGATTPVGSALALKGVALAIADGISSSPVSDVAAETAVKSFLTDYYCTSDAWSVKTSARTVISATNSWLHAETRRSRDAYDMDRGYVCTFSALVLKARTAHVFHVGDSQIARLSGDTLEPLTEPHRVVVSSVETYLGRALGMAADVEIDYRAMAVAEGDLFLLSTDGVHEHVDGRTLASIIDIAGGDLDVAARSVADAALKQGSEDNLTVQIVRIDALPDGDATDFAGRAEELPPAPILEPPAEFEGYNVLRQLHANNRSRIYLATEIASGQTVALKVPAVELRSEPSLLRQFAMEEWIARRVSSPHLLKNVDNGRPRRFLYVVTEYLEGQTLRQWMHDNPTPGLEAVRGIAEQIVKGLRALHRKEMVHCDLRPENVMIDGSGTVKLIDFGSVRVAGVAEAVPAAQGEPVLGTVQYTAPEVLAGETPTWRSDMFSLGVTVYEMLTGRLPYGAQAARVRTVAQQRALRYATARDEKSGVPDWIDGALKKAVHPDPFKRYAVMSEFMGDLRAPNPRYLNAAAAPLAERDPVLFWKVVSFILAGIVFFLLLR